MNILIINCCIIGRANSRSFTIFLMYDCEQDNSFDLITPTDHSSRGHLSTPQWVFSVEANLAINPDFSNFISQVEINRPAIRKKKTSIFVIEALKFLILRGSQIPRYYFHRQIELHGLFHQALMVSNSEREIEDVSFVIYKSSHSNHPHSCCDSCPQKEILSLHRIIALMMEKIYIYNRTDILAKAIVSLVQISPEAICIFFQTDRLFKGFANGILSRINQFNFKCFIKFVLFEATAFNLKKRRYCQVMKACLNIIGVNNVRNDYLKSLEQLSVRMIQEFPSIFQGILADCEGEENEEVIVVALKKLMLYLQGEEKSKSSCHYTAYMNRDYLNLYKLFQPTSRLVDSILKTKSYNMHSFSPLSKQQMEEKSVKRQRLNNSQDGSGQLLCEVTKEMDRLAITGSYKKRKRS